MKVKYGKPRVVSHNDTWANNNPSSQRVSRQELMQARNIVLLNSLFPSKQEDILTQEEVIEIQIWFDQLRDMPSTNQTDCLVNIPQKIRKHL